MKRTIGIVLGAAIVWGAATVSADEPPDEPPRIVVRGTAPLSSFEPSLDVTAFGSVVDTRDAPRWVTTLADVLDDELGVRVRRFGGLGDFSTVSVRGSSPGQLQVYLDGVPLTRADDETVDLADLPLDAIERVEIYRGVTALDFAQSSPGGVINLVPRRPDGAPLLAASVGVGSFGTRKATLTHANAVGPWDYLAFAQYLGGEGDFEFTDDRGTTAGPNPGADDRRVDRRNADFDGGSFTGRVRRSIGDRLSVAFTTDTFAKEQGVPGRDTVQSTDARRRVLRQLANLKAGGDLSAPLPTRIDAGIHFVYREQDFEVPLDDPAFAVAVDAEDRSMSIGGQTVARTRVGSHQTVGVVGAIVHERFEQRDDEGTPAREPGKAPTRTRLRTTLGIEDEVQLFDARLQIVPSLRWEHVRDDFPGDSRVPAAFDAEGTPTTDVLAPRLGVRAEPIDGVTLLGNVARYERVPNLRELFGAAGLVVGDPDLESERAVTWDIGTRIVVPPLGLLDEGTFTYSYFESDIDDAIVLIPSSVNVFRPANVAAARLSGHELAADAVLGPLRLTGNYSYQEARDEGEDEPFFEDNFLPGRPRHQAFGRVALEWPAPACLAQLISGGLGFYEISFIADNFLDRANLDRVDERLLHAVGLELRLPRGWRVGAEVRNLTDDQTRDVLDFPLPGRSAFVTLSYGFGRDE